MERATTVRRRRRDGRGVVRREIVGGMGRRWGIVVMAVALLSASCASSQASRAPTVAPTAASSTPSQAPVTAPAVPDVADAPVVVLPPPDFTSTISEITPELAARMEPSWRPGCPVPLEDLRYVTVTHRDFDGEKVQGELVVHADAAEDMVTVFRALFDAGYPVRSMRLVDDFGASDDASMDADNTSAFNCRAITGRHGLVGARVRAGDRRQPGGEPVRVGLVGGAERRPARS